MLRYFLSIGSMIGFLAVATLPATAAEPPVKMSSSGLCHASTDPYYSRTKTFTPYRSIADCVAHGGRVHGQSKPAVSATPASGHPAYHRDAFGGWQDYNHDCRDTRAEVLQSLSTGPVAYSRSGCTVVHGRWNDPYTGTIFTEAHRLDIDHMVPLAYAWSRGADQWPSAKREKFANDPRNLFAVSASANRAKGAMGPTEWMPPSPAFQCQYVLRFQRLVKTYGLHQSQSEQAGIARIQSQVCR